MHRLAALCREHLLTEKIVVVPSLAIGHQIADAVAHSGTSWINLRPETMRTLADAVAGFALAAEGITVLSRAQALGLIERACDRALDSSSYFAALAGRPGLHRAIQQSIDDLRHARVDPAGIRPAAFEDPRKARDLANILAAYEEELKRGKYIDRYGVLARATAMLEAGAPRPWRPDAIWAVIDEVELTAAEERFLQLASQSKAGQTSLFPGVREAESQGPILLRNEPPSASSAGDVAFRRAAGEENELRGAFRSIIESKTPFDDAEIVYTTRDPYLPLAYELASEYDVPCTFAEGIGSHYTRPGQACIAFLRWIGNGWHASDLQPAARAGAFASRGFARVLRNARIGWGRDRYVSRVDALIAAETNALQETDNERRRSAIERTIADAREARTIIEQLLSITEDLAEGETIEMSVAAKAASRFVAQSSVIRNEADSMAREGLVRMLGELAALPAGRTQRADAAARLIEAVRNLHVSASNPRPGFLHVAPLRAGAWSARQHFFITGLDEAKHPGSGLQDPILLDLEREAIGVPVVGDRPHRVMEQFRRFMTRASGRHITLSYASLDLGDRRERFPSASLLEVFRNVRNDPDATYDKVAKSITREGFVDPTPLSPSEWWLMRRFAGSEVDLGPAILEAYAGLAAGAEADAARDSDSITRWDGRISASADDLDPRRNGRVYSASQLETMAGCPYRFFLQRLLKIEPLDEIEFDPDIWLEGRQFGTLLHEVLQDTMEEICGAGAKPSLRFLSEMEAIAGRALDKWRAEVPPPSDAAFERRRDELMASCRIFLQTEEKACETVTPKYFEVSFGSGESEGVALPEPFSLPLGGGESVKLRGRIDRVDHDETRDEWHVWDYKSGVTWEYDKGGVLRCGTKIQHAIYARALAAMLEWHQTTGAVTESGYVFPTPRGRGARVGRTCSDAELKEALNAVFDVVSRGYFPHAAEDNCRFCDYKSVCESAKRAAERTKKKLAANPDDPAVQAWLRLQAVR